MKTRVTLLFIALFLLNLNCEKGNKIEYLYSNQEDPIKCSNANVNNELIKEAYYSYEEDMKNFFAKSVGNRAQGISIFVSTVSAGRAIDPSKVSEHSVKVLEQLKKEPGLWVVDNGKYHLDYDSELVKCLGDNITDQNLRTTFKALVETNSMNSKLFAAPLRTKVRNLQNNKFLGTFVALDMYYANLMNVDFSTVKRPEQPEPASQNVNRNTPPSATTQPKS